MRCPKCGLENPEGGIHCDCGHDFRRDGSRLVAEIRDERECPHCAELILKKARVCKHCGRDVEPVVKSDSPAQTPSPAPPQRIAEPPTAQAQASNPAAAAGHPPERAMVGSVLFQGAAVKTPWLRTAPEPPGRMKYNAGDKIAGVVLGLVLLAIIVGGIWYFSQSGAGPAPKVTSPSSGATVPSKEKPKVKEMEVNRLAEVQARREEQEWLTREQGKPQASECERGMANVMSSPSMESTRDKWAREGVSETAIGTVVTYTFRKPTLGLYLVFHGTQTQVGVPRSVPDSMRKLGCTEIRFINSTGTTEKRLDLVSGLELPTGN